VKGKDVINFFEHGLDKKRRESIVEVCCDMSATMELIISIVFPNASIVTDRFHMMKNVLEDIGAIRTRAKTAIKKRINEEAKQYDQETNIKRATEKVS
jgi:transposase